MPRRVQTACDDFRNQFSIPCTSLVPTEMATITAGIACALPAGTEERETCSEGERRQVAVFQPPCPPRAGMYGDGTNDNGPYGLPPPAESPARDTGANALMPAMTRTVEILMDASAASRRNSSTDVHQPGAESYFQYRR